MKRIVIFLGLGLLLTGCTSNEKRISDEIVDKTVESFFDEVRVGTGTEDQEKDVEKLNESLGSKSKSEEEPVGDKVDDLEEEDYIAAGVQGGELDSKKNPKIEELYNVKLEDFGCRERHDYTFDEVIDPGVQKHFCFDNLEDLLGTTWGSQTLYDPEIDTYLYFGDPNSDVDAFDYIIYGEPYGDTYYWLDPIEWRAVNGDIVIKTKVAKYYLEDPEEETYKVIRVKKAAYDWIYLTIDDGEPLTMTLQWGGMDVYLDKYIQYRREYYGY